MQRGESGLNLLGAKGLRSGPFWQLGSPQMACLMMSLANLPRKEGSPVLRRSQLLLSSAGRGDVQAAQQCMRAARICVNEWRFYPHSCHPLECGARCFISQWDFEVRDCSKTLLRAADMKGFLLWFLTGVGYGQRDGCHPKVASVPATWRFFLQHMANM